MKIVTGIVSTTHVDLHRDQMAKEALDDMASQINDRYIPLDINHQGTYVGVILAGKVKRMEDGEYGLYGVMGIFETVDEVNRFHYGSNNIIYQNYLNLLENNNMNPIKLTIHSDRFLQKELEQKLHSLDPYLKPEIIVRKAYDAIQITSLVIVSADLLVNILQLLATLRQQNPKTNFQIKIESGGRSIDIKTDQEIDAPKIIEYFMSKVNK